MECVVYYNQRGSGVYLRFRIPVLLGHTKVDDVDRIRALGARAPDQKVVRFDIPVDEILLVDRLHSRQLS